MRLALQVYRDATRAELVADLTAVATNVIMTVGRHGYLTLEFEIPAGFLDALRWYEQPALHIYLNAGTFPVWEGRLEDVAPVPGGVRLTAYGYWRSMFDLPYTALWCHSRYNEWFLPTDDDLAGRAPEKYVSDVNSRLYSTCLSGESYVNGADALGFILRAPHRGENDVLQIDFDYDFDMPTDWRFQVVVWDFDLGSFNIEDTVASAGSNLTGSKSLTLTSGYDAVEILVYNNTGGLSTPSGDTGTNYLKITGVEVRGTTSANVYADEIAEAIITFITGTNSSQLSDSTTLIESPAVDLLHEVYEDRWPGDVLIDLAQRGDNQSPPQLYEVGVMEGQRLYFRERGSEAQTWSIVNAVRQDITRSLEALRNSAYGLYQDENGNQRRTANSSDASSVDQFGLTRRRPVQVSTTSDTEAQTARDTAIENEKDIIPQAEIEVMWVLASDGGLSPPWMPRPGDIMVLRDLPPAQSRIVDRVRSFWLDMLVYELDTGIAGLVPEAEPVTPALLMGGNR